MRHPKRWLGLLALLAVGIAFLFWRQRLPEPTVTLDPPRAFLGRRATLALVIASRSGGLRSVEARLTQAGQDKTLLAESFPAPPPTEIRRPLTLEVQALGLKEGPADLRVWARDSAWRPWPSGAPRLVHSLTVDLTPPTLELLVATDYVRHGGAGVAVYRAEGASRSGVQVGSAFFPGVTGLSGKPTIAVALFTIPHNDPPAPPTLRAEDEAGNQRALGGLSHLLPARFPKGTVELSEAFLRKKLPELAPGVDAKTSDDLLQAFLRVNREGRQEVETKIHAIASRSGPNPLWQGAFQQQPNSKVFSNFPEERIYRFNGRVVDTQHHLGFDLASRRQAPVEAANAGIVLFTGPLGIYGNAVILDHGLGLATLYAHLSQITVTQGQSVSQGEVLGRSGETGLAGGDHIHFAVLIHGVYTTPLEWWDAKWIRDHIGRPLHQAGFDLPGLTPAGADGPPEGSATPRPARLRRR
jgi:murein DD-endopeptidase MepM/ murein hydrolase activator NlpD